MTDVRRAVPLRRWIDWGLAAAVLIAPAQFGIVLAGGIHISPVDPLVWAVAALALAAAVRCGAWSCFRLPPAAVWVLLALGGLSLVKAQRPLEGVRDLAQWFEYFVVAYALLRGSMGGLREARRMTGAFLLAGTAVIAAAVAQYAWPAVDDFHVRGLFANRNVFGGYLCLLAPLALGLLMFDPAFWRRAWMAALVLAGLAVTLSGGAAVSCAAGLLAVSALAGRRAFAVVVLLLSALTICALPNMPRRNLDVCMASVAPHGEEDAVSPRYTEWQAAARMTRDNPWLGVGAGNYQSRIGGYFGTLPKAPRATEHDTQNLYLVLASSLGLPAMLVFVAMLFHFAAAAAEGFFGARGRFEKGLALGVFGAIVSFSLCCVWHPLLVRGIGVPLAALFAAASAVRDRVREQGA